MRIIHNKLGNWSTPKKNYNANICKFAAHNISQSNDCLPVGLFTNICQGLKSKMQRFPDEFIHS